MNRHSIPLLQFDTRVPQVHIVLTLRDRTAVHDTSFALPIDTDVLLAANRIALQQQLNMPVQWLRQVHGTGIVCATRASCHSLPVADAAYTQQQCALAVITADCLPVVLYTHNEIAIVHAGWRSLSGGLIGKTLLQFQAPSTHVYAWLGPAIRQPSYQVGSDMRQAVLNAQPEWESYFAAQVHGKWLYDLAASARHELTEAGVAHIDDCGFDTFVDSRFYSYRKEGAQAGRFATCVWRNGT